MNTQSKTKTYMLAVVVIGIFCLALAIFNLPWTKIDFNFFLLFLFTIGFGSRITLQIPRFKSHIAVSDTFIFLALLLYGGEIAIVLAAVEAFLSSWRFCKKKITVFFNFAAMAFSTTLVVSVLYFLGFKTYSQAGSEKLHFDNFFVTLSVMALVQFITNTSTAAIYGAFKSNKPFWETWKTQYAWTFITYFVGALSAGSLLQLTDYFGFTVVIASFPIIFFIFLSYRMYMKNVEMSLSQAEQAEKHAAILEQQSIALRESEERFRSAFNYAPIGIGLVSPEGNWLKANRALCQILGYREEEFLNSDFQSMIFKEDLRDTELRISALLSGETPNCQMEQRYLHKMGKTVWASWSASTVTDSKSDQPNLIFQLQDITDKKLAEEKLQYEATHDALTNLPNRAFFLAKLEQALEKVAANHNHKVCVLFIDLDRFKIINDSLGHFYGDMLLIEIADRLRQCLRPNDIVARLGGDEFTILVEGNYDEKEVIGIAERIQTKFAQPFQLANQQVYSSASIGILHNTNKHYSAEEMMRDADTAMYQAKRAGKARHEIFDENMHEEAKAILMLENDLRRAVERDEFSVYYQPIYSVDGSVIQGFEALARWEHARHGFISPDKFIPLAEEIGLIDILGLQILRKACQQGKVLKTFFKDSSSFMISVNLSCQQFAYNHLVEKVKKVLEDTQFPPDNLKLEITESVFFEHKEKAVETLHQLRKIGVEINIDNFGTGYSNLTYLMQLPISTLKVDRTFINPMDIEGKNLEIMQTILNLARSLGIRVIAGGVENENQFNQLKNLKYEGAQGYFFAKPMSFEKTKSFLENKDLPHPKLANGFEDLPFVSTIQ
ncbi:MAG: EAL domain-containing protein [Pyrinomonadaceae bacterium]